MTTKKIKGEEIKLRSLEREDLKKVEMFQDFLNSLIDEKAKIKLKKKKSVKEEEEWLKKKFEKIKREKEIYLVAATKEKIIGNCRIQRGVGRMSHVGKITAAVRKEWRREGVGQLLTESVLERAKETWRNELKIAQLRVFENNEPAINLYHKLDFEVSARLPDHIQYEGKLIDELVMTKKV